jgi:hypothetical protein
MRSRSVSSAILAVSQESIEPNSIALVTGGCAPENQVMISKAEIMTPSDLDGLPV